MNKIQVDLNGWLTMHPKVFRVPSMRTIALETAKPLGLVWHWTGGPATNPAYGMNLAHSIRSYERTRDRAASWHCLVTKDGRLIQSVPFVRGSWHVGRPGKIGNGRLYSNINQVAIGIELENSGKLMPATEGQFCCWPYWVDPNNPATGADQRWLLPAARAVQHGTEFYDGFPEAQVQAATQLLIALVLRFKWNRDVVAYGHRDFDPQRKQDPGPLWQDVVLPGVLDTVFGRA